VRSEKARPAAGERLCRLDEIPSPGAKNFRFRVDAELFAAFIVRRGEAVVGYVDSCPHVGWPLGSMDQTYLNREASYILCSGHGALFEIEDGTCVAGPCFGQGLTPWPVELRGDEVFAA
jgi:nitrite reductase/ring-hydroxylating ferredoxin subunit